MRTLHQAEYNSVLGDLETGMAAVWHVRLYIRIYSTFAGEPQLLQVMGHQAADGVLIPIPTPKT